MANRLFQTAVLSLNREIERVIGIVDENGKITACSNESLLDEQDVRVHDFLGVVLKNKPIGGYTYKTVEASGKPVFTVFCEGDDPAASGYAGLLAAHFSSLKKYYDEKYDKNSFIKNIIVDNILPGDVLYRAREMSLPLDVSRAVFLVRTSQKIENSTIEVMQNLFPDRNTDYVVVIDEKDVVVVKEVDSKIEMEDLNEIAHSVIDVLAADELMKASVGISSVIGSIQELARAYRESRVALEVGNVFDVEKDVVNYNNLGIGRLIYQLPTTLCDLFMSEVFKKEDISVLDDEIISTIQKFFENNLNVSETSRKLFVHRNTLVYRLDKIKRVTGLDLREFDHAIVFKVAMMINKYMATQQNEKRFLK